MGNVVSSVILTSFAVIRSENVVLATFDGAAGTTCTWKEQNDPVMGGKSSGTFNIASGSAIFDGVVEDVPFLRAPGFIKASTTDSKPFPDISSCTNIDLEVKSTENFSGYRFSFGTSKAPGGKFFASGYKSSFTAPIGSFRMVSIPIRNFTDFWDDATGDPIKTCFDNDLYCPDKNTLTKSQDHEHMGRGSEGQSSP